MAPGADEEDLWPLAASAALAGCEERLEEVAAQRRRFPRVAAVLLAAALALVVACSWGRSRAVLVAGAADKAALEEKWGTGLRQEVYLPPETADNAKGEISYDIFGEVIPTKENRTVQKLVQALVHWPPDPLKHSGDDCWTACGNISGDCAWCGRGNACCRLYSKLDPPECDDAHFPVETNVQRYHTCVTPTTSVPVKHSGQDCWKACSGAGFCDWCGLGNACCRKGLHGEDPPECTGATYFPVTNMHTCVSTIGKCSLGKVRNAQGDCVPHPEDPPLLVFYAYHAQVSEQENYSAGFNLGNAAGTLWYLHNEVVTSCPRKFGITGIARYKVIMKASRFHYSETNRSFGPWAPFQNNACLPGTCPNEYWKRYGYTPGCKHIIGHATGYSNPIWYSLPGPCPEQPWWEKSHRCVQAEPGGKCRHPDGSRDCTWNAEPAGWVSLQELENLYYNYTTFCDLGNWEYDAHIDAGVGMNFWDGKPDAGKAKLRVHALLEAFKDKYPNLPTKLGDVHCEEEGYYDEQEDYDEE